MKFICTILFFLFSISLYSFEQPVLKARSSILMDFQTGRILFEDNADQPYPPASMTKLVTLYLTYDAISKGELAKNQVIHVSSTGSAFSRPPRSSLMLLEEGQKVDLLTIMKGVAVSSGNDGAYQLAELVAGNPSDFVELMNETMENMGFVNMRFYDPDGWSENNVVTARELALFSKEYINRFPAALEELHSVRELSYPGPENVVQPNPRIENSRTKRNTNLLLGEIEGVDGLKTGYIDESGFNFAATARRGNTRFIAIVMGIFTDNYFDGLQERADEAAALLEYGFEHWETSKAPDSTSEILLWMADESRLQLKARNLPLLTLSEEERKHIIIVENHMSDVKAPVLQEQNLGNIKWFLHGELIGESDLCAAKEIERASFWNNLIDFFPMIFYKIKQGRE